MEINERTTHSLYERSVQRAYSSPPAERRNVGNDEAGVSMKDTARTSALARILSEALRQARSEEGVREEKIHQFRHLAGDDAAWSSDDAIDAIFSRMLAF